MEEKADTRVTTNTHGGPRRHTGGHPDTRGTHGGTAARNGGAPNKMVVAETAAATAAATADKMVPEMVVPILLRVVPGFGAHCFKRVFSITTRGAHFFRCRIVVPPKKWGTVLGTVWDLVLGTVGAPRLGHRWGTSCWAPRVPAARGAARAPRGGTASPRCTGDAALLMMTMHFKLL